MNYLLRAKVWQNVLAAPTWDRYAYLQLHRFGLMGADSLEWFIKNVKAGDCVLDVGGNIGLYGALFARCVGAQGVVHSFEPHPKLSQAIAWAKEKNQLTQWNVHPVGLGKEDSQSTLVCSRFNSGDNAVTNSSETSGIAHDVEIKCLDNYLNNLEANLIKIDVQGFEYQALQGMRETCLRSPQVKIFMEVWPFGLTREGTSLSEITDYLMSLGFEPPKLLDGTHADVAALSKPQPKRIYCDVLFEKSRT